MSNITVIECNKQHSNTGESNASWINTFQAPIRINEFDVLQMKTAIIDTNATNSSNITFDEDVNISIEMGYYFINGKYPDIIDALPTRTYLPNDGSITHDYLCYVARYSDSFELVKGVFSYQLLAGSYTASNIAEELTRAFSKIQFQAIVPGTGGTGGDPGGFKTGNVFLRNSNEGAPENFGTTLRFYYQEDTKDHFDDGDTESFAFVKEVQEFYFGASQVSLVWNRENNGRFSFDYLHTPLLYQGAPSILINTGSNATGDNYVVQNRRSGVFFTEMKPKSFWNALGFNVSSVSPDSMLTPIAENGYDILANLDTGQGIRTTGGFVGLTNALINPYYHADGSTGEEGTQQSSMSATLGDDKGVSKKEYNYTSTNATYAILADVTYDASTTGGFYLISLSNFTNDYREDSAIRQDIQAIVSKQYTNNNYITAFQSAGIPWINDGPAFDLSSIKVEILDPKTKLPAANDLGENNAVFLQIIHSAPKKK